MRRHHEEQRDEAIQKPCAGTGLHRLRLTKTLRLAMNRDNVRYWGTMTDKYHKDHQ
jgi:hypothetical protein